MESTHHIAAHWDKAKLSVTAPTVQSPQIALIKNAWLLVALLLRIGISVIIPLQYINYRRQFPEAEQKHLPQSMSS